MEEMMVEKETSMAYDRVDSMDVKADLAKIRLAMDLHDQGLKKWVVDDLYHTYYWLSGAVERYMIDISNDQYDLVLIMQKELLQLYLEGCTIKFNKKTMVS